MGFVAFWRSIGLLTSVVLAASGSSIAFAAPRPQPLAYSIEVLSGAEGDHVALRVCLATKADPDGTTEIALPNAWGRGTGFYKRLERIRMTGETSVSRPQPDQLTITSPSGADLTLCYDVSANLVSHQEASITTDFSQPLVGPDFIHVFGPQVFPWIDGRDDALATFSYRVPEGWRLVSDLEHLSKETAHISDVFKSVILAGKDLSVSEMTLGHTTLRIAMRGEFGFDRGEFETQLADILRRENAFWQDSPPNFLVTVIQMTSVNGQEGIQGSSRGDAFALIASPKVPKAAIGFTFAHEYFHTWNLARLGGYREGDQEIEDRWLSEGFTDYFARKFARASGVFDDKSLRRAWEEVSDRQANSPVKSLPNARIASRMAEGDAEQLPYDRGALFACYLDNALVQRGLSLETVMLAMRTRSANDPSFSHLSAADRLVSVTESQAPEIRGWIETYIENGEDLPNVTCY